MMKENGIILIISFFLITNIRAQEDRGYKIYQFPPNMIPRIDGNTDDYWAGFPEEYVVGVDQLWDDSQHYPEVEDQEKCLALFKDESRGEITN